MRTGVAIQTSNYVRDNVSPNKGDIFDTEVKFL